MKPELSFAQSILLMDIAERPRYVAEYFKPAVILVEKGMAEWKSNKLIATEKGRAIVEKHRAEQIAKSSLGK